MSLEVRAVAKYIGMSAQKVRLVADLVRGMPATRGAGRATVYTASRGLRGAQGRHSRQWQTPKRTMVLPLMSCTSQRSRRMRARRSSVGGLVHVVGTSRYLKRSSHITVVLSAEASLS